ncbi:ABC transporter substrate-binding protein [Spartinivicinus ruber]|uniref:ABC transporter substrate-binding protein n=1 Tax=Spartinivicinus ruber TaxID=2683272 RepID=UPI0013D6A9C3|nr:ABC transporter substrate binding protein [Spartinivicinus ruber]
MVHRLIQSLLIVSLLYSLQPSADSRDILIIESYHSGFKWSRDYVKAISESLPEFTVQHFQMDTKRLPPVIYPARADKAWKVIQAIDPILIFLGDDNALQYLSHKISETNYPAVYLGINSNPRNTGIYKYKNITGVLERPLLKRSLITAKRILPNLKKVLLLFDDSTTSHHTMQDFFQNKPVQTIGNIETHLLISNNFEYWQESIRQAKQKGYQAIWPGLYFTLNDESGKHVNSNDVIHWISTHSTLPLFAFWDFAVGKEKAIGGLVMTGRSQGYAAAKIAKDILNGTKPENILPQIPKKGELIYSKTQLKKWKITLPETIKLNSILLK